MFALLSDLGMKEVKGVIVRFAH